MRNDAEEMKLRLIAEGQERGPTAGQFFMEDDPRITRIGKFLRKSNLDELPQFWNVLKGGHERRRPAPQPRQGEPVQPRPGASCGLSASARASPAFGRSAAPAPRGRTSRSGSATTPSTSRRGSFLGDLRIIWQTVTMILRKLARS